jgi:hypothetical protein
MWCGGGHLHKDCPEKGNTSSTPGCCNCQLAEGEKPHPANYRGCKRAKEEMRKKHPQGTPKPTPGRVFSSNIVKPHLSSAEALRGQAQKQPHQEVAVNTTTTTTKEQTPGQSVQAQAPTVSSEPTAIYTAITVALQIMAELKDAASEEAKFLGIAKIVFKFMNSNGK